MAKRAVNKYGLTNREIEIIEYIGQDGIFSKKDIAKKLVVEECTISAHLMSIYDKIGTNRIAGVVKFYFEEMRGR